MRSRWLSLVVVALVVGCGPGATSGAGQGGAGSGGTSSGGTSSGGTSSGGTSSGGTPANPTATEVCRIATLGFRGQWGDGDVFTEWLDAKSSQGTRALGDSILTADLLAPFQIVVVQDVRSGSGQAGVGSGIARAYGAEEIEALRQWVARGGGLMTLMGYGDASEIANVNRLLEPYGLSYGSQQVLIGGGATTPVTHWADHPISAGVTSIGVNNGYAVAGGGTLVAWEPVEGQHDAGRALDVGEGRVFAWADEWITYNSEWNGHPEYQVARFWANALGWLSQRYGCTVPIPPGEF